MATDQELAQQHTEVMAHVGQLERLTGSSGPRLSYTEARNMLRQHLQSLHRCLLQHFAAEEEDGYFGSLRAERPDLDARIERLKAQHAPVLEKVAEAVEKMSHARLDIIEEDVRAVLQTLREHEAGERALMQDAANLDLGGG